MISTHFGKKEFFYKIKKILKKPKYGFPILIFFFIILPFIASNIYGSNIYDKIIIFIIIFFILIFISELFFHFIFRFKFGYKYLIPPKVPFKKIHVEPHPYLPFIYKENFVSLKTSKLNFPLQNQNYTTPQLRTNNYRFVNGLNGNRNIKVPKPKNLFRINCIGGSTTGNYITLNKKNYSYPLELEKILNLKSSKKIEVNNCGQGGYNSADLLVRFALQIIDTKPDIMIIYHGFNDIRSYLTPNFKSDYSNSRKSLGESYWKFFISSKFYVIPLKFINYISNFWFPYNIRNSLLDTISKGSININSDFSEGLSVYKRNIQHIIDLCLANNIEIILSTFCYYLHSSIKNDPLHILFEKIVKEENKIITKLANKYNLKLIDNASLIPKKNLYFLDSIHFTPAGMQLLAKNISEKIHY